ncbi:hypothetical protein [Novosphingobium sp. SG720]|uniref:hypothetical protein n=1 Tax=Novosphingobium sp. SG720 TaxID=2586998 RepID=UPI001444A63A|nr:hypothetical protein [Novosphingobium sp. SG720]NKJ44755.1 hypothetical protein [Novosphingobium sp. SG720]
MLKRWWQDRKERRNERQRLALLEAALEVPVELRDLDHVYPIILPGEILDLDWVGPCIPINETPFALAWAEVRDGNAWTYVSFAMADWWNGKGLDWQRMAFQNLRNASELGANGEKLDCEGRPFMKVMLQADAFGPSRLLIPGLFQHELGAAYQVAIPERTCAVAHRSELTVSEASDVEGVIKGCFAHGTEPMSPERFHASTFWKPAIFGGW